MNSYYILCAVHWYVAETKVVHYLNACKICRFISRNRWKLPPLTDFSVSTFGIISIWEIILINWLHKLAGFSVTVVKVQTNVTFVAHIDFIDTLRIRQIHTLYMPSNICMRVQFLLWYQSLSSLKSICVCCVVWICVSSRNGNSWVRTFLPFCCSNFPTNWNAQLCIAIIRSNYHGHLAKFFASYTHFMWPLFVLIAPILCVSFE